MITCEHGEHAPHVVVSKYHFLDDWVCRGPILDGPHGPVRAWAVTEGIGGVL